jgi:U4/U6 small nuclear ribonucleoprotein PRP3
MVEKRPHPEDHGASPNGVKRAKPAGDPANGMDRLAAAKLKAAELKAQMEKRKNAMNSAPSPAAPAAGGASDRLAAMKARVAALRGTAPSASTDAAPVRPPPSASYNEPSSGTRGIDRPIIKSQKSAPKQEEVKENPYFDPKAVAAPRTRVSRGLLFNQRGKYLEQASKLRQQSKLEEIKALVANRNRLAKLDENSERGFLLGCQPPDPSASDGCGVEWWDEGLLDEKTYESADKISSEDSIITIYVQHPVLLKAPQDQLLQQIKPMYLTSKEQAKLRRMRRAEEHKEEQAKIRLGLVPPPPPKVKRGNMMKVMGDMAVQDPTAVEMLVESQIAERHDNHVKANEDRKLSKEERHSKLQQQQTNDQLKGLRICAFSVGSTSSKQRYQIDVNAKQLALLGICLFSPELTMVIVEGGNHSIEKYKKLMMQRIKWTENAFPTEIQVEKQASDPQWLKPVDEKGHLKDLSENKCTLVFEGEIRSKTWRKWGSRIVESDGEAKEVLGRYKLDSLWALAKARNAE